MAITTIYDGIEYRSRLEARWAAFMRNIGWDIVYEPFDGDGYIPDFLVMGDRPLLVEVKPAVTAKEYEAPVSKAESGLREHWRHDILIVGASPISQTAGSLPKAGWYGEYCASDVGSLWMWSAADWLWCLDCRSTTVRSSDYDWSARPCGHDQKRTLFATERTLRKAWADACNDVKWRGRDA